MALPDWARAHGGALFTAQIRTRPTDFDVTEELGFDLTGDGEHDFLFVEKTGANTEWVARQLARFAGVPVRDIGYAGLKDRHAVTRQWFSVPRWHGPEWPLLTIDGVQLLRQGRHARKLKRGAHAANRFRIVLRGDLPDPPVLARRLRVIESAGVPNYFGEQRFGRDGANVELADAWAASRRLSKHRRGLAISASRSWLFNEILEQRVREASWDKILPGDTVNLDGTASVFVAETPDADLRRRCEQLDIHPAGPLCGAETPAATVPPGRENWLQALVKARVKSASRSLRLRVAELAWSTDDASLELCFTLRRGGFATAVLRELASVEDVSRSPANPGD